MEAVSKYLAIAKYLKEIKIEEAKIANTSLAGCLSEPQLLNKFKSLPRLCIKKN